MEEVKVCSKCGHPMSDHYFLCGCTECRCMEWDRTEPIIFGVGGIIRTDEKEAEEPLTNNENGTIINS